MSCQSRVNPVNLVSANSSSSCGDGRGVSRAWAHRVQVCGERDAYPGVVQGLEGANAKHGANEGAPEVADSVVRHGDLDAEEHAADGRAEHGSDARGDRWGEGRRACHSRQPGGQATRRRFGECVVAPAPSTCRSTAGRSLMCRKVGRAHSELARAHAMCTKGP